MQRNRLTGEFAPVLEDGRSVPRSLLDMAESAIESVEALRARAVEDLHEARLVHGRSSDEEREQLDQIIRAQRVLGVINRFAAELGDVLYLQKHRTEEAIR
jgi:hypothetical protein